MLDNRKYKDKDYWDKRYHDDDQQTTEWLCGYKEIRDILLKNVKYSDKILMLGTGDSDLSYLMFRDGFANITNVDYSSIIIEKMSAKFPQMSWICADIRELCKFFPQNSFDVVIEKATLDSLLVEETNSWNPSENTVKTMNEILHQIYNILPPDGTFLSITFSQPHFRLPFLMNDEYLWSIFMDVLGESFHYFVYTTKKCGCANFQDLDKYLYAVKNKNFQNLDNFQMLADEENENFLNSIEL